MELYAHSGKIKLTNTLESRLELLSGQVSKCRSYGSHSVSLVLNTYIYIDASRNTYYFVWC